MSYRSLSNDQYYGSRCLSGFSVKGLGFGMLGCLKDLKRTLRVLEFSTVGGLAADGSGPAHRGPRALGCRV